MLTLVFVVGIYPQNTHAGVFSFVNKMMGGGEADASSVVGSVQPNSQTMPVLQAALNTNPVIAANSLSIVDGSAIESFQGPSGTAKEIAEKVNADSISTYVVRNGDSLSSIAKMYAVSTKTILLANNLKSASDIHPGDELVILPISGVQYTILKNDTLKGIANKYNSDVADILAFNDLTNDYKPVVGDEIIIPEGETITAPTTSVGKPSSGGNKLSGYFIRPTRGTKTQGLHGKYRTAVDLANKVGTNVLAAAQGTVIIARAGGYNGGYGNYIVVQHPNGVQTLYGHLSEVLVSTGSHVSQGDLIGKMGDTGNSTGPHLHFEILGGVRNWNPFN